MTPNAQTDDVRVSDAPPANWVDRYMPPFTKPYLRLMRADRPIGTWLLLWPCWWSAALAWNAAGIQMPDLWLLALFAIGATAMRGAGCTYNDIADRKFDAQVARTQSRPIPSGQVSVLGAAAFMVALSFIGLAVLLQFNSFAIALGMGSLGVVALYPFMKRITYWPQFVLGLAFSWGALMGWAEVFGGLALPAYLLYAAAIMWTIGYDTIYAHQDKEDDALVGLKSTALKFGVKTKPWLMLFYGLTLVLLASSGLLAGADGLLYLGIAAVAIHFGWQIATLDVNDPANCLHRFRSNREAGAIIFAALLADAVIKL
ncbi:MAG: 4-hydroxybenzoate octaprenyltransferase [Hyphomicrobiales bacterium]|nr:4-hydroxybenzoate octaprenyltransferase [Hyphomicrobiales bacterium]